MRKMPKSAVWTICLIVLSAGLAADKVQPLPGPVKPYLGMDIAVVRIGTTGAPEWAPTFTLKNQGVRRIMRNLEMVIRSNGGPIASGPQWVDLYPGKTFVWKGGPQLCNFAKVGDVVEVTIDADNKMAEDNEANNTLSRTIRLRISPAVSRRR